MHVRKRRRARAAQRRGGAQGGCGSGCALSKVNAELDKIVKMKATQSAYPAMSRQDKRIAEYHADRMTQESSLQRDMQKAERMADRDTRFMPRNTAMVLQASQKADEAANEELHRRIEGRAA